MIQICPCQSFLTGLLLSCLCTSLVAQELRTVQGRVRDSTGLAMEFVSVIIRPANDGRVLAFTRTDETGQYLVSFQADTNQLVVIASMLGYREAVAPLRPDSITQTLSLTLFVSNNVLREVTIRAKVEPIKIRGDTTEYHVAAFADSTERNIEELLQKLPGISVGSDGKISVNGVPVEKVLIEGDNLFGQDYTLALRNIRADLIEKVQAIDHYQSNALLKTVKTTDATVLNLTVKGDHKQPLTGNASIGGGYGQEAKYYLFGNLFSFRKSRKTYLLTNINNTGEDARSGAEFILSGGSVEAVIAQRNSRNAQVESILSLPQPAQNNLPAAITNPNRTALFALHHIANFSPRFKVLGRVVAIGETIRQTYYTQSNYQLDTIVFQLSENNTYKRRSLNFDAQLESEWLAQDGKGRWKSTTQYRPATNNYFLDLQQCVSNDCTNVPQQLTDQPVGLQHLSEYTRKISGQAVLQVEAQSAYQKRAQQLTSQYNALPLLGLADAGFEKMGQSVGNDLWRANILARHLSNRHRHYWALEGGWAWNKQYLNIQQVLIDTTDNHQIEVVAAGYGANLAMQSSVYHAATNYQWQKGHLSVSTGLELQYWQYNFSGVSSRPSDGSKWILLPRCRFNLPIGQNAQLIANYGIQQRLPGLHQMSPGLYWTDYRSLRVGLPDAAPIIRHGASVLYTLKNERKSLFLNILATYNNTANSLGTDNMIDPFFIKQSFFRPAPLQVINLKATGDRFFARLSSRFALSLGSTQSRYINRLAGTTSRHIQTNEFYAKFDYGSGFAGWLNGYLTQDISFGRVNINRDNSHAFSNQFTQWQTTATVKIRPAKQHVQMLVFRRIANFAGNRSTGSACLLDARYQIRLGKNGAYLLHMQCNNLFNNQVFEQFSVTELATIRNGAQFVPRFFLITLDVNLR